MSKYPPISLYGYHSCCHDVHCLHQSHKRILRQNEGPKYKKLSREGAAFEGGKKNFTHAKKEDVPLEQNFAF